MAKKKKGPRVRQAKAGDRNLFRKLWMEHITEAYETKNSEIKPTEFNLDKYSVFFDLYVDGRLPGVVLFVSETAVLMAGSFGGMPFEMDESNRAMFWGLYVKPDFRQKGQSKLILGEAKKLLKDLKFDGIIVESRQEGGSLELRAKLIKEAPRTYVYLVTV